MNNRLMKTDFGNNTPDWQKSAAFNTYWQYSYVNRSAFYANIRGEYQQYMRRWVQNYLWWYDGWVPYFHDGEQGIFSTRLATSLVNGIAKKVVGGRIFFKNAKAEHENDGDGYRVNKAFAYIRRRHHPDNHQDQNHNCRSYNIQPLRCRKLSNFSVYIYKQVLHKVNLLVGIHYI